MSPCCTQVAYAKAIVCQRMVNMSPFVPKFLLSRLSTGSMSATYSEKNLIT